jgi:NDP-sugar pyrophosphorylase family protein
MKAVIQSGGKGMRLRPYTTILPKPLMPVGSKPVLELLLKWLRRNGIREVYITTGHLGHLIRSFCGDGSQWNLHISYTEEPEPLGTVGALSLLRDELDKCLHSCAPRARLRADHRDYRKENSDGLRHH